MTYNTNNLGTQHSGSNSSARISPNPRTNIINGLQSQSIGAKESQETQKGNDEKEGQNNEKVGLVKMDQSSNFCLETDDLKRKIYKSNIKTEEVCKKICRICLCEEESEDDPVIAVCLCKGSSGDIHLNCLQMWLS